MTTLKTFNEPPAFAPAYICVRKGDGSLEKIGDITCFGYGSAIVMDYWSGNLSFFDTREEALMYVKARMCGTDPIYAMM